MWRWTLILMALGGCRPSPSTPPPPVAESVQADQIHLADVLATTPAVPQGPCAGRSDVVVQAPAVVLICEDGHRRCSRVSTLQVRNCSQETVVVRSVDVTDSDFTLSLEPAEGAIEPRAAWSVERTWSHEGAFAVTAEIESGGEVRRTEAAHFVITNPARDAAVAACRACRGDWGTHGMASVEGCICATTDGGKFCDDGEDCEGPCLFDRFEVVQSAAKTCEPDGSCHARFATGRPVGRCSSKRTVFGCRARIRDGASRQPPTILPARAPRVCVD